MVLTYGQRKAGYKIKAAMLKFRARRRMGMMARKRRGIRRAVGLGNPTPTFVETFSGKVYTRDDPVEGTSVINVPTGGGLGFAAKVKITDVPQHTQYETLYKQYRINWVKLYLLPAFNGAAADVNAAAYNYTLPVSEQGMSRIVYSIQDSPNETFPATEQEVLLDNGCKIKAMGKKFTASFKPVPDIAQTNVNGTSIWTRQKFRQWINFDENTPRQDPLHGALTAFINTPGIAQAATGPAAVARWYVYYKVSFSLRDPK